MANDYAKYGLTYQAEQMPMYADENVSTGGRPAGFTDVSGNFYTEIQADSLYSNFNKGLYVNAGGNADAYIDPNAASADARGTYAKLTRNMFDEWQKSFQPLETSLLSKTTYNGNPGVMTGIIAEQTKKINSNFDSAQGVSSRNAARYGMTPTVEQKQANDNQIEMDRNLAQVDMANKVRTYQGDLNRQILGTGAAGGLSAVMSTK